MANCRLLSVDVDGTLLDEGRIDGADAAALRTAAEAGIIVCLCTGRSWLEVRPIWRGLGMAEPFAPVICVGGALVAEPQTGRTLYSRPFDAPTAADLAQAVQQMHYPVMALVDAWREGFDYFVLGAFEHVPLYRRFFDRRDLRIRRVDRLDEATLPRVLRISLLAEADRAPALADELGRRYGGRIEVQAIHLRHHDLHIVEAFMAGTNKFTAMVYVGQGYRIAPNEMAAIGDDHNDLPMLAGAGFSATTADAPQALQEAADMVLAPRGQGPVAQFVRALLDTKNNT